jgi:hypothetical protein
VGSDLRRVHALPVSSAGLPDGRVHDHPRPLIGRALNHVNPRWIAVFGFAAFAGAIFWASALITSQAAWGWVLLPVSLLGIASASVWSPLSVAAARDLPLELAGAGSGVYNSMRQIGGVLGTAG